MLIIAASSRRTCVQWGPRCPRSTGRARMNRWSRLRRGNALKISYNQIAGGSVERLAAGSGQLPLQFIEKVDQKCQMQRTFLIAGLFSRREDREPLAVGRQIERGIATREQDGRVAPWPRFSGAESLALR